MSSRRLKRFGFTRFNPRPHQGAGATVCFQRYVQQRLKVNFARTLEKLLSRHPHISSFGGINLLRTMCYVMREPAGLMWLLEVRAGSYYQWPFKIYGAEVTVFFDM